MKNIHILLIALSISCGKSNSTSNEQVSNVDQPTIDNEPTITEAIMVNGKGKITTIADGLDVERVNLFSSTDPSRTTNCYLVNGDKVNVIEESGPYYLIEKADGNGCKGYCMKNFVVLIK